MGSSTNNNVSLAGRSGGDILQALAERVRSQTSPESHTGIHYLVAIRSVDQIYHQAIEVLSLAFDPLAMADAPPQETFI